MTQIFPMVGASVADLYEDENYWTPVKWPPILSPRAVIRGLRAAAHPSAIQLMEQARERQVAAEAQKNAWLGEHTIDPAPHIATWDANAKGYAEEMLAVAVAAFPVGDGLAQANDMLRYGLEMEKAEIAAPVVGAIVQTLVTLRLWEWGLDRIMPNAGADLRADVLARVAARELPTRDNVASEPRHAFGRNQNSSASSREGAGAAQVGRSPKNRVFGADSEPRGETRRPSRS